MRGSASLRGFAAAASELGVRGYSTSVVHKQVDRYVDWGMLEGHAITISGTLARNSSPECSPDLKSPHGKGSIRDTFETPCKFCPFCMEIMVTN